MIDLRGQAVLITGSCGTAGVGIGVVEAVREAGGLAILNARAQAKLDAALKRFPGSVGVVGDVSKPEDAARMIAEASQHLGVVHHLVNNAGIGLHQAPHACSEDEFDRLFGIDVRGLWLVTRAWLQHRLGEEGKVQGPAALVNISSVHGERTMPGYAIYAGAKGAVEGMTRGLAVHYGPAGIRCNAVSPGYVHSDQNFDLIANWADDPQDWVNRHTHDQQALPELIDPVDVGRVVTFLLSAGAAKMTGQVITVDAGLTKMLYPRSFV